jgi:hypothetical protein
VLTGRICRFLLALTLLGSSTSAFAVAGELTAVEHHCGPPSAESKETSEVTNQLERTLIYNYNGNSLYLHFRPVAGGWSFTTAWNGHLPMSRQELENRLPCFRNAMQEAAAAAPATTTVDPTISGQSLSHAVTDNTFGIPHFALIVLLVITLLVLLLLPSARQRQLARQARKPVEHVYRKPNLDEYESSTHRAAPLSRDLD